MGKTLMVTVMAALLVSTAFAADDAKPVEDAGKVIAYLLDYVAKSDFAFIRNGKTYDGKQASAHIKGKYEHFKDEIKTPEDFIRLAATKSMLTGTPYRVKSKDGKESRCDAWLKKTLEEYRKGRKEGEGRGARG